MIPTALVIGDTHFKNSVKGSTYNDSLEFIQRVTDIAKKHKPTFIVLLGDILDSHKIQVHTHKLAEKLISNLSAISQTYILIGNHDFINNSQFLTDNHIFTPFKKWKNVHIADVQPLVLEIAEKMFIFCPYTPPGRFQEALDKLTESGYNWDLADCIFAHQEFKGASNGKTISTKGDDWDEDFPIVISGHIHEESQIRENIFYTGSSTQVNFGESQQKNVWIVKWEDEDESSFKIEKISVVGKIKKNLSQSVESFVENMSNKSTLKELQSQPHKIVLTGNSEEIKAFKKSKLCKQLSDVSSNVSFEYELEDTIIIEPVSHNNKNTTYREVFHNLIKELPETAHREYESLFGRTLKMKEVPLSSDINEEGPIELVFEGYS
jgi:DNA repair exonuclease SbcCD nuclease subunit